VPVPLFHGALPILGFRIGSFAYLTDCNRIPDESFTLLAGVRTLIIDALRQRPHSTHFSVSEATAVAAQLGVERAYFTHISHDLGHAETSATLPAGVELAYDGLVVEIP
jgi:phosphoribosyl 1,2-cyclic phosphate phosphodiesterase